MYLDCYKEISRFLSKLLPADSYFCCVYGSYPAKRNTSHSDIDLFVACESTSEDLFKKIELFVLELHSKYGLKQDEEVPYANKLLVSYSDVAQAVNLQQFRDSRESRYTIPRITKNSDFLSSPHIRMRLIFNAMTSPHEFISGNVGAYLEFRDLAEHNLTKLVKQLIDVPNSDPFALADALICNDSGEEGEMYLGYKNYDCIKNYLAYILSKNYEKGDS